MRPAVQTDMPMQAADDILVVSNDAFFGQEVQERCGGTHELHALYRIRDLLSVERGPSAVALVDIDSFGGISRCFDALRAVRRIAPHRPVMIVSRSFRYDDFSLERAPVCDASLAWPSGTESLLAGISVALANNRVFQQRNAVVAETGYDAGLRVDAASMPVAAE